MSKPLLDRVTVTGADNSISPFNMIALAGKYPYAEWGILLSKNNAGCPRYPGKAWLVTMVSTSALCRMRLSAHICGRWVRDLCLGGTELLDDLGHATLSHFNRMQLNFHAVSHSVNLDAMTARLFTYQRLGISQFILQLDGVNDGLLQPLRDKGLNVVGLYDLSGGAGVLPEKWKKVTEGYCGYAGGLSPENVSQELEKIAAIENYPIWIDAETHLRSDNNARFDLEKVQAFLEKAREWVKEVNEHDS